jgi:hypothetical protein
MRKRLDKSIAADVADIQRAEEEVKAKEVLRQKEEADRLAAAAAAEKAEQERLAKLPPSVTLDRDIPVKQLKLAKPDGRPA